MKRIILFSIVIVLLTSCSDSDMDCSIGTTMRRYIASFESNTKTSINVEGTEGKVNWVAGDVIKYFSSDGGEIGKDTISVSAASADLELKTGSTDKYIVAMYGDASITSKSSTGVSLQGAVKPVQSGKFEDAHISFAKTTDIEDNSLYFRNATALLQFTLLSSVDHVIFTAYDGIKIHSSGNVNVSFDKNNIPQLSLTSDYGECFIRVNTNGSGTFYISLAPCQLPGFSMDFYASDGTCLGRAESSKALALSRNSHINLGVIDAAGGITASGSRINPINDIITSDLSSAGTANCYIISQLGTYTIKPTFGNSSDQIQGIAGCKVMWESFCNPTAPRVGQILNPAVFYQDGKIIFSTNGVNYKGNALIAAVDNAGEVLWSWHIWLTDPPAEQVYNNNAGTMMDRNLGATSAGTNMQSNRGLSYQWGRKDPFISLCRYTNYWSDDKSSVPFPNDEYNTDHLSNGNALSFSISHPTTYIKYTDELNKDWYAPSGDDRNDNLWSSSKTIYDPCPVGWRVPDHTVWSTALNYGSRIDGIVYDKGCNFGIGALVVLGQYEMIWYPATGWRDSRQWWNMTQEGLFWSCDVRNYKDYYGYYAYCFTIMGDTTANSSIFPNNGYSRSYAGSVRCMKM